MPKKVTINFENTSLEAISVAKECAPTKEGFKRYFALEFLYNGMSPTEVSKYFKVAKKTIYRWIKLFNEEGLDGLALKGKSGRPRKIPIGKFQAEYLPIILDPKLAGEDNFTAIKFHSFLRESYEEDLCYQTLLNYYHEQKLSLVVPRPSVTDKQDAQKREGFIEAIKKLAADKKEIWFSDEVGFEGDPRPRARWVKKGSKPVNGKASEHIRFSAIGSINPLSGEIMSLVVPGADQKVFQIYLDEFSKSTDKREIYLVLDNASWHKAASLNWHNIKPVYLPPYSPDYNPIENLWRFIKLNFFNNWYAKTVEDLIDKICLAFNSLTPQQIKSTTNPSYLLR